MNADWTALGNVSAAFEHRHLWERIADELRKDVLSGALAPNTKLIPANLAKKWGVSRGPVREALAALENEGIVISTRRHGTVVATPSGIELSEVFSVREAIELAAGRVLCGADRHLTKLDIAGLQEELDRMNEAHERNDNVEASKSDLAFHQAIADFTGNSRFSAIIKNMISQNTQHQKGADMNSWPHVGWSDAQLAHRSILDALANRDEEAYAAAVTLHYQNARARASQGPFGN